MKCELRKMKSDVVKGITLGNMFELIKIIFMAVILAAVITTLTIIGLDLLDYQIIKYVAVVISVLIYGAIIIQWRYVLYKWYKNSHEWCNNRRQTHE